MLKPERICALPVRRCRLTSEHFLALAVEDDGTGLEVLSTHELRKSQRLGVRRAGRDGLRLALLLLMGMRMRMSIAVVVGMVLVVVVFMAVSLSTFVGVLMLLLLGLHGKHALSLDLLDEFGNGHASLGSIFGDAALQRLELLGGGLLARNRQPAVRGRLLSHDGLSHQTCQRRRDRCSMNRSVIKYPGIGSGGTLAQLLM